MLFQREIGQKLSKEKGLSLFGIREMNVELKDARFWPVVREYSTTLMISSPKK